MAQLSERTRQALLGFILGDALGAGFEFHTPAHEQIQEQWNSSRALEFTDDTYLLLSSLRGVLDGHNWATVIQRSREDLLAWFEGGDLRGIGITTSAALNQLRRHIENGGSGETFRINPHRGYQFDQSAGNGALTRALPLVMHGFALGPEMRSFIEITHLHPDAHWAVDSLHSLFQTGRRSGRQIDPHGPGFWCVETLVIAETAVDRAKNSLEAFAHSQRPAGDNDSTAALALALWVWERGWDNDLARNLARLSARDSRHLTKMGLIQ